jgi:hypothetical protein
MKDSENRPGVIQIITVYRWTDGTWDVNSATKPGGDYSQESLTRSTDTDAVKDFISNEIDKAREVCTCQIGNGPRGATTTSRRCAVHGGEQ